MWLLFAFLSAFFAGLTAILAKIGIKDTDSDVVTALRTVVVLAFSWLMVFVVGSQKGIGEIEAHTLLFLVLSGCATGASWLCYFKALKEGDLNKVAPIDKSSTVLTMLFVFIFLGESVTPLKVFCMVCICAGTLMMITKRGEDSFVKSTANASWLIYAVLSAVFASLTSILGKVGISGVESNLGTAIRTGVVLVMAWLVVFAKGKQKYVRGTDKRSLLYIVLSGVATGASWLCYYRALKDGNASVVAPIDKLGILITVAFSYAVLKEKLSKKALFGLVFITAGTLLLLV